MLWTPLARKVIPWLAKGVNSGLVQTSTRDIIAVQRIDSIDGNRWK